MEQEFPKLFEFIDKPEYPEGLAPLILSALVEVTQSPQGRLSRQTRLHVLKLINNPRIEGRIAILCALRAYPLWRTRSGDRKQIMGLLRLAESYLWYPDYEEKLQIQTKNTINFLGHLEQGLDPETVFAGLAAIRAVISILSLVQEVPENMDDPQLDSGEWDSAYIASLIEHKRADNPNAPRAEHCRAFWEWYLTRCIPYAFCREKPISPKNFITIEIPEGCREDIKQRIGQLNKAIHSHVHAPTNRKDVLKMEPYSRDPEVIQAIIKAVKDHPCIPSTTEELELFCSAGTYYYDIIGFWYCIATLALSPEVPATEYLMELARQLIEEGPGEIDILQRILLFLPEKTHLLPIIREITKYHEELRPELAAFQWFKESGIPYPGESEWSVSVRFTTDKNPSPPSFSSGHEERETWYSLTIEMFSPRACAMDYTLVSSYNIHLKNATNTTHGEWNEGNGYLIRDGKYLMNDTRYTPLQLAELLQELSEYGIIFPNTPASMYTSKKIPSKAVEKWFSNEIKLYTSNTNVSEEDRVISLPKTDSGREEQPHPGTMPREEIPWIEDGNCYIIEYIAGYFACGRWKPKGSSEWQGKFVIDLRSRPLNPVILKKKTITQLVYSKDLDYYAALDTRNSQSSIIGGKNPLEADTWVRLCGILLEEKSDLQWRGKYLCASDNSNTIILTMNRRGVEYVSRLVLPETTGKYGFGLDGKGMLYISPECSYDKSNIIRYEDNGKYMEMPFHMFAFDALHQGCIPVLGTSRLLLLHEYGAGGWTEPGILELDMATRQCRLALLPNIGPGSFRFSKFTGDWVLVQRVCDTDGSRFDHARFWNRLTGEVLRLRPWMLKGELFELISALPDGTIVIKVLRDKVGSVVYIPTNFWEFLRTKSRPMKIGNWLNYPKPYPDINYFIPPESDDPSFMIPPPYETEEFPELKPKEPTRTPLKEAGESTGNEATNDIEINNGSLKIRGVPVNFPLSCTAISKILGKEKPTFIQKTKQDNNGKKTVYDRRSCLVWDEAGIVAIRDEENPYNISTLYLQIREKPSSESEIPVPSGVFAGKFLIDGKYPNFPDKPFIRNCLFEILQRDNGCQLEITIADTRDQSKCWQEFRTMLVENLQAANEERDNLRLLERDKRPENYLKNTKAISEMNYSRLLHLIHAIYAGYAMGRSIRYLKSTILLPFVETMIKAIELNSVKRCDILYFYSTCILLGYEKANMKRLAEKMAAKGIRDAMLDRLIRVIIPDWEISGENMFPELERLLPKDICQEDKLMNVLNDLLPDQTYIQIIKDALLKIV